METSPTPAHCQIIADELNALMEYMRTLETIKRPPGKYIYHLYYAIARGPWTIIVGYNKTFGEDSGEGSGFQVGKYLKGLLFSCTEPMQWIDVPYPLYEALRYVYERTGKLRFTKDEIEMLSM